MLKYYERNTVEFNINAPPESMSVSIENSIHCPPKYSSVFFNLAFTLRGEFSEGFIHMQYKRIDNDEILVFYHLNCSMRVKVNFIINESCDMVDMTDKIIETVKSLTSST